MRRLTWWGCGVIFLAAIGCETLSAQIVVADFEGTAYGDWVAAGKAFGSGPVEGTLPNQNPVSGFEGGRLVNSYVHGDGATGTLTSPPFVLSEPYLNLLVGGGGHRGKTCVNFRVGDKTVVSLTGRDSEHLDWRSIDVRSLQGEEATLEFVDEATGSWGHVLVDHIVLEAKARGEIYGVREPLSASRTLRIDQPYLLLPVKTGAPKKRVRLLADNRFIDEFEIEWAYAEPDFNVFVDLSRYVGQELVIEADIPGGEAFVLEAAALSDALSGGDGLYREKYRPQFHFSPRRGWNNDPNGLVYFQGEYHLFFQHNPYGWNWGNMHWGHAVSRDLVHWEELPIAVYPRAYGDWAFSGSAIIDWDNRSGFQTGPEPPMVIAYTSTGRGECIAYSNDRGRTFTEFSGNPVVEHDGRDPKIIWHAPTKRWVMAVYEILNEGTPEKKRTIGFYTSPDLKAWTHQSNLAGYFECPELFELPVDGNPEDTRWIVYAADNQYTIGQFDGTQFTPETDKLPGNHGNCLYAAQTFSDVPASDGRRIEIGWGRVGHKEMPFNQLMTFPTSLTLQTTPSGIRLFKEPVWELTRLQTKTQRFQDVAIAPDTDVLADVEGELLHVEAAISPGDASSIVLTLGGVPITYDAQAEVLRCMDQEAPLPALNGQIHIEVLVDRLIIEIFGNQGAVYMPIGVGALPARGTASLTATGGPATATYLQVHHLRSAWR